MERIILEKFGLSQEIRKEKVIRKIKKIKLKDEIVVLKERLYKEEIINFIFSVYDNLQNGSFTVVKE